MKNRPAPAVLTTDDERLVGTREVLERIPIHRSTLNAMITAKRFPPPLKITPAKLLWRWSTILAWLDERERHPVKRREFQNLPRTKRSTDSARARKSDRAPLR